MAMLNNQRVLGSDVISPIFFDHVENQQNTQHQSWKTIDLSNRKKKHPDIHHVPFMF